MPRAFAEIAFTPAVKALQEYYGSRDAYARIEASSERRDRLGVKEGTFISRQDSFYLASVGANGWPYVQHRGGPRGFVSVLDDTTLRFTDYDGNRQFITTGNIATDPRVTLIFVDQARQQRLKIWGLASVAPHSSLANERDSETNRDGTRSSERIFTVSVKAVDWNCPQHITPRYTAAEIEDFVKPLYDEIETLRRKLKTTE